MKPLPVSTLRPTRWWWAQEVVAQGGGRGCGGMCRRPSLRWAVGAMSCPGGGDAGWHQAAEPGGSVPEEGCGGREAQWRACTARSSCCGEAGDLTRVGSRVEGGQRCRPEEEAAATSGSWGGRAVARVSLALRCVRPHRGMCVGMLKRGSRCTPGGPGPGGLLTSGRCH